MPEGRRHKRTILIRCKHCDKITNMDWEGTTADEFNNTIVSNSESEGPPLHRITESLKRLRKELGYGEKCKE